MSVADKRSIDACLICASGRLRKLRRYEKDHLVACEECSFVFSSVKPTQDELDRVYAAYSRTFSRTEATLCKMRETAAGLKALSGAKRVLDIGCGDGELLTFFIDIGCEAYGSEYDSRTEAICRSKGITMLPGGVLPRLEASDNPRYFDLVIFTEVIEHINNPRMVIDNIYALLRTGGILYITTPNFTALERMVIGPQWGMICYPEHIAFYSPKTSNRLLETSGFERVLLRTENISIFRIVEFINRRRSDTSGAGRQDAERISAATQGAVERSAWLRLAKKAVSTVLGLTGTGTSLVAIYRRK